MAVVVAVGGCTSGDKDESIVSLVPAETVGRCLDFEGDVAAEVTKLPYVDCGSPHTHEVFAIADSEADVYPGLDALQAEAQTKCLQQFEDYVGINPFDSELFASWLVPTVGSWEKGDRQIVCVAGNTNAAPLVGRIEQSKR